jgi:hypothetical protein
MLRLLPHPVLRAEYLLKLAAVTAAYFLAGELGLSVPFTSQNVSPVWPAAGVALAAVLIWGCRMWPGIAAGAFLVNFFSSIPHPAAFGIAVGNSAEPVVAAVLLARFSGFHRSLVRLRDILALIVFGVVLGPVMAASIGVTSLFLVHARPWSTFLPACSVWWLGDGMGMLLVAPVILTMSQWRTLRGSSRLVEIGFLMTGITLYCLFIFDDRFGMRIGEGVLAFGVFPFVVWAATRFGVSGAALANLSMAAITVWETATGSGPFVRHGPWQNAALLQLFLAVISMTGLALAAVIAERERVEDALEREQQLLRERERAEEALRYSQQRLFGIINSAMDAIITVAGDQKIVVFNRSAERMFRCSAAQAIGCPIDNFIPERFRHLHQQHIQDFGRTGVTSRSVDLPGALFAIRADGEEFPIEATISQVEAAGEKLYTVILRDISVRQHIEEQLRQAQKIEAVGQLAGGIAHEFNNFLGIILGYSQLLLDESAASATLRRSVAEIQGATRRAASLTRQLLAFGRRQVLQEKVLDINHAVRETHMLLRRLIPENIELVTFLGAELWSVKVDPTQIQQVLINLVVNARDAMPEGGKVVIETGNLELEEDNELGVVGGCYVVLTVADTGSGMDPETQSHIFEPFFTTKEQGKGTGLGLPTIYGIVKQSGGEISVVSAVGKGTRFRIYLPSTKERAVETDKGVSVRTRAGGTETILVVEDESALRELVCESLAREGYTTLSARDGMEALEVCEQHPGRIHLVLTDLIMPRLNGLKLKERAAPLRPDAKFLFISGYIDEALEKSGLFSEESAFMEKPFVPGDLVRKVRELLDNELRPSRADRFAAGIDT